VDHHEGRPVHARDHLRHRERLAGTGDAEQDLVLVPPRQPLDELVDRPRLVAAELEVGDEPEGVVFRRHVQPTIVPQGSNWFE
jgi:hypothetical protein